MFNGSPSSLTEELQSFLECLSAGVINEETEALKWSFIIDFSISESSPNLNYVPVQKSLSESPESNTNGFQGK